MTARPQPNDFGGYFGALHGYEPFPWQRRLAATIVEDGAWPDLLDIPTGLGKTSAIDVALFALAVRPDIAPRRIVLVVDRRVVVDQAADHARRIQRLLATATEGPLMTVAVALRELWGGTEHAPPFEVAVLRGGMPRDEAWAHRPDRPVVALSTVDQVGSRLLFRGYGVSAGMAPVHAGLLGHDALILLDEVQLSTAFAETLRAIGERWRPWRERDHELAERAAQLPNRWAFVRMSATPVGVASESDVNFALADDDLAHPIVEKRRGASKLATLAKLIPTHKTDDAKSVAAVTEAFSLAAARHFEAGATRIAVIVNRVATARAIHQDLASRLDGRADVVLLTGRMRPLDRDEVFGDSNDRASVAARVIAGSPRHPDQRPVVVVSTQTIEAGADFDFDALVTECASLDALRQRFGRLDRRGELGQTRATILIRKDQAAESKDDPVYGSALSRTWAWLNTKAGEGGGVDFGIANFPSLPSPDELAELCSPVQHAPVMLPAHLDAWAQTNPRGEPDPDVALWLHGPERGTAEVRIVWRADLDEDALNDPERQSEVEAYATASLGAAPPSSLESISVPLFAFHAWVANEPAVELADVEGAASALSADAGRRRARQRASRSFLIASKSGAAVHREPADAFPEATVIVPATYGGIRDGNWSPDAGDPVRDLGDWAQIMHRGRPVLRLVPELLGDRAAPAAPASDDPEFEPRRAVRDWLQGVREDGPDSWKMAIEALLRSRSRMRVIPLGGSAYFAAVGRQDAKLHLEAARRGGGDIASDIVGDDDDSASYIGHEIALDQHLADVERWARRFAVNVDLPAAIADDLVLAARLHDIGKADPRFQQMLHGGSPVRAAASKQLLAKSRGEVSDRLAREQARLRAGYPSGYRHELLSVAMLERNAAALAKATDPELVLHLVGSHHGWCRPFAPAVEHGPSMKVELTFDGGRFESDAAHGLASLDSGVADRYWRLTERYGWWTLAWFETLVRLADHRASEESARGDVVAVVADRKKGAS